MANRLYEVMVKDEEFFYKFNEISSREEALKEAQKQISDYTEEELLKDFENLKEYYTENELNLEQLESVAGGVVEGEMLACGVPYVSNATFFKSVAGLAKKIFRF